MPVSITWYRRHQKGWSCTFAAQLLVAGMMLPGLARGDNPIDRTIVICQKILRVRPDDASMYYRLGDAYIQKGRETGDITYYQLASQALQHSLKIEPDLGPAQRHLAYVFYSLHNFAGAAREADQAIAVDPLDSNAYGVLGDAQLETGQYAAAARTYATMAAIKDDLYSYSRRSGLETIRGEDADAIADLKRAIADGQRDGAPAEAIAWANTRLAEDYFLLGRLGEAAVQDQAALRAYPGYYRALASLGQVRAAQGRLDAAATLYRGAIAVIPLPEYAVALGDVYTKLGRPQDAQRQRELVEFIARLNVINRVIYNRVLVDYYADHDIEHDRAIELAAGEFKTRRDIYGQDALAWSLYRGDKASEALPHIIAALQFGTTDARLYFHAGMIYAALGRKDLARTDLARALAINPHFQPILDQVAAQEYAALGGALNPPSLRVSNSVPP
ncbi:MAG: tetratricopeptide repeat protein [Deltaproteobacteria bacterium]|nr:tetratricopeptide repeat protein [Deltaproteobacteria bacterium]